MPWFGFYVAPWIVFAAWWIARAPSAAKTERKETLRSNLSHRVFLVAGMVLLILDAQHVFGGIWSAPLWPSSLAIAIAGVALECIGVAFAIWARETLGRNWSGTITLKEGHRLVTTGPYALARHPIYTGLMLGFIGLTLGRRDLMSCLGFALLMTGIGIKLKLEERLMREHFGAEYVAYKSKVKAIIPFIL